MKGHSWLEDGLMKQGFVRADIKDVLELEDYQYKVAMRNPYTCFSLKHFDDLSEKSGITLSRLLAYAKLGNREITEMSKKELSVYQKTKLPIRRSKGHPRK